MPIRKVSKVKSSHSTSLDGNPPEVGGPKSARGTRGTARIQPVVVESEAEEVEETEYDLHKTELEKADEV